MPIVWIASGTSVHVGFFWRYRSRTRLQAFVFRSDKLRGSDHSNFVPASVGGCAGALPFVRAASAAVFDNNPTHNNLMWPGRWAGIAIELIIAIRQCRGRRRSGRARGRNECNRPAHRGAVGKSDRAPQWQPVHTVFAAAGHMPNVKVACRQTIRVTKSIHGRCNPLELLRLPAPC